MWRTLHELIAGNEEATGRLKIETIKTKDGPVRCLRLLGRKDIAEKLIGLPIILADATLPLELVRHYLPSLDLVLRSQCRGTAHAGDPGDPDCRSASRPWCPSRRAREASNAAPGRNAKRPKPALRASGSACRRLPAPRHRPARPGHHLQRTSRSDFAGIENVEVAHFGAIEGIDRWGNVDVAVIIGTAAPQPGRHRGLMAAAITGEPVIAGPFGPVRQVTILQAELAGHDRQAQDLMARRKPRWSGRPSPRRP